MKGPDTLLLLIHSHNVSDAGGDECGSNIACRIGGSPGVAGFATGITVVVLLMLASLLCLVLLRRRWIKSKRSAALL